MAKLLNQWELWKAIFAWCLFQRWNVRTKYICIHVYQICSCCHVEGGQFIRAIDKWVTFLILRDASQGRKNLYIIIIIIIVIITYIYLEILLLRVVPRQTIHYQLSTNWVFYFHIPHTTVSTITNTFHSTTVSVTTCKNSSHNPNSRDKNTANSSF
jgi:hypothetical protein